jgi:hypothetical protein
MDDRLERPARRLALVSAVSRAEIPAVPPNGSADMSQTTRTIVTDFNPVVRGPSPGHDSVAPSSEVCGIPEWVL